MTRRRLLIFAAVLAAFAAAFLLLNRDRLAEKKNSDPYEISVIIRGKNTESWTTIKQGIDQAAKDLNCDVSFVTLSSENNAGEQIRLMQREIANGANAIVIAPVNTAGMEQPVQTAMKSVPVVTMESTVATISGLPYISCDNYRLGTAIAGKMIANNHTARKIAVLRNSMDCSSILQSYQGVLSVLQTAGDELEYWPIPDDPQEAYDAARTMLQRTDALSVVALDGATLEAVAKAERDFLKTGGRQVEIYGLGRTDTVVSLLESGVVNSIGVENEFNVGYLSIQTAVGRITHTGAVASTQVNFAIVDRTNMYNSDNQRLLFPFVQ